jgi:hypothetical protein
MTGTMVAAGEDDIGRSVLQQIQGGGYVARPGKKKGKRGFASWCAADGATPRDINAVAGPACRAVPIQG